MWEKGWGRMGGCKVDENMKVEWKCNIVYYYVFIGSLENILFLLLKIKIIWGWVSDVRKRDLWELFCYSLIGSLYWLKIITNLFTNQLWSLWDYSFCRGIYQKMIIWIISLDKFENNVVIYKNNSILYHFLKVSCVYLYLLKQKVIRNLICQNIHYILYKAVISEAIIAVLHYLQQITFFFYWRMSEPMEDWHWFSNKS